MTPETYLWFGWFAYFIGLEGYTLWQSYKKRKLNPDYEGKTLSEHVWSWFGTDKNNTWDTTLWGWLRRSVLLLFLLWLMIHFMFGGRII